MFRDFKDPGMRHAVLRLYRTTEPATGSEDLHQRLSTTGRPALVVWGARHPYLPVWYAHRQQDTFANTEVIVLSDSGHWPIIDNPVAVEALVTAFLHRVLAGRSDLTG
ncbi:MAG: alpha/beta hydrolase [Pseudonocardiales bacterium]|nr:alpha/beta hydrolase [Pseudonocardiales bacterium]